MTFPFTTTDGPRPNTEQKIMDSVIDASSEFNQNRQHVHTDGACSVCEFDAAGSGNGKTAVPDRSGKLAVVGSGFDAGKAKPRHVSPAILEHQVNELRTQLRAERQLRQQTQADLDEACKVIARVSIELGQLKLKPPPAKPFTGFTVCDYCKTPLPIEPDGTPVYCSDECGDAARQDAAEPTGESYSVECYYCGKTFVSLYNPKPETQPWCGNCEIEAAA